MGGEHPAVNYIQEALDRGKHVVTANKEVMAKHGPELLARAAEAGVQLRFEASAGAGIPIIGPLAEDLLANDISSIHAIINGTTNFILTKMAREGMGFEEALRQAQELGYAEADPSNDIEGVDAAYKLAILSSLAFRTRVHASDVFVEGITRGSRRWTSGTRRSWASPSSSWPSEERPTAPSRCASTPRSSRRKT